MNALHRLLLTGRRLWSTVAESVRRPTLTAALGTGMLLAGGFVVACGDASDLPNIDDPPCDDSDACDDAVELAWRTFSVRCAAPKQALLGERVGEAGSDGRFAEARAIDGEDPADFVALRTRGDGVERCGSLAYVIGVESFWAEAEDISRVVCSEASVPDEEWCAEYPP